MEGNALACPAVGAAIDPKAAGFEGRSAGHSKYSCFSYVAFFFFSAASRKAVTYFSKLFCYVRVIQSTYVTLRAKAFSCSALV